MLLAKLRRSEGVRN